MSPDGAASLDDTIRLWRQGDCVPGPNEFVFRLDPKLPSTPASQEAVRECFAPEGVQAAPNPGISRSQYRTSLSVGFNL